jgi:uncharacterized protein (TIGR00251 family)
MAARVRVHLTPRGGRDEIGEVGPDDALRVRVRAAPADGAANEALVRLVAGALGVAAGQVRIERGHRARHKTLLVEGTDREASEARWPGAGVDAPRPRMR